MRTNSTCCQFLDSMKNVVSPFSMVGLAWYDGFSGGILRCDHCRREYKFAMVDVCKASTEDSDTKVLVLSPLRKGTYESFSYATQDAAQQDGAVPSFPRRSAIVCAFFYSLLMYWWPRGPAMVIVWESFSEDFIVAARKINASEKKDVTDWCSFMELARL